jgi:hypothetical protein
MTLPDMELTSLSLSAAADLVAARKVSPLDLAEAFVTRAQKLDPQEGLDRCSIEAGCIPTVGGNLVRANGAGSGRRSDGV